MQLRPKVHRYTISRAHFSPARKSPMQEFFLQGLAAMFKAYFSQSLGLSQIETTRWAKRKTKFKDALSNLR